MSRGVRYQVLKPQFETTCLCPLLRPGIYQQITKLEREVFEQTIKTSMLRPLDAFIIRI
jgi:hypothetical protein